MTRVADRLHIEAVLRQSECNRGWREDLILFSDFAGWTDTNGVQLGTGTTPELVANGLGFAIKYDHGDGASNVIKRQFTMPREFAWALSALDTTKKHLDLVISLCVAKVDASADENEDLKFQADMEWSGFDPLGSGTFSVSPDAIGGTALPAAVGLTTPALSSAITALQAATGTSEGAKWYDIDVGAAIAAEEKELWPGSLCTLVIGPNETVGSGDMDVEIKGICGWIRRHAGFVDRRLRAAD